MCADITCANCGTILGYNGWEEEFVCPYCGDHQGVPQTLLADAAGHSDTQYETSNPGAIGRDTGYKFRDGEGNVVRVIAKSNESTSTAIQRVRQNHGM